ncbi:LysR family transcriptional regulator [Enterobacteriaceae bacterium ESL0689]|nr:LysR family transcriptional regulator [Enterobacteriaceae bacterium ESL0689]
MQVYSRRLPSIKQLQYFLAVCEERNFRKAAAKLGISQPPLSVQIKELENKLNSKLLIRNTQHVLLTKEGEIFREETIKLMGKLCQLTNSFQSVESRKVIIGMTKTLSFDFIPIFKQFLSDFKENSIIYKDDYTSKELIIELQKKNMDFAVVSYHPIEDNKIFYRLIHQEPMVLAIPESHTASKNEYIDLNDVMDLPLYWFNRYVNPIYYDQCEQAFKNLLFPLIRRAELPDTLSMLLDISLGRGMLFIPKSNTRADVPGVVYKKLIPYFEKKFLIDIFLVWKEAALNNEHAQSVIDCFNK